MTSITEEVDRYMAVYIFSLTFYYKCSPCNKLWENYDIINIYLTLTFSFLNKCQN